MNALPSRGTSAGGSCAPSARASIPAAGTCPAGAPGASPAPRSSASGVSPASPAVLARAASRERLSRDDLRLLGRLSAAVAARDEPAVEEAARALAPRVPRRAAQEAVLQTYLLAGFPAAINGFMALERAWPPAADPHAALPAASDESFKEVSARASARPGRGPGGATDDGGEGRERGRNDWERWRTRGEALCAAVYGPWYARLRRRMRELSPELDEWMVVEGYGKTLGRSGLAPAERELCAVAALAVLGAARQLEAHLEGARRMGADPELVAEVARTAIGRHAPAEGRDRLEALLGARPYSRAPSGTP